MGPSHAESVKIGSLFRCSGVPFGSLEGPCSHHESYFGIIRPAFEPQNKENTHFVISMPSAAKPLLLSVWAAEWEPVGLPRWSAERSGRQSQAIFGGRARGALSELWKPSELSRESSQGGGQSLSN